MDDFVILARSLIAIGLALLLVMLRLEAEKFGTAEYDEATRDGERPRIRRRASPGTASASPIVVALLFIHPTPQRDLFLGSGDRLGRGPRRDRATGSLGVLVAVSFATYRYHRIRFPDVVVVPGRAAQLDRHRVHRRGHLPRRAARPAAASPGVNPTLANLTQAILYTLATRLGAPGRDRYLLLLTLGIGLLGGWLTVATGGIAAAFLGHAITRFAVFLCTGHAGQTKPRAREVEEIEKRRRPPEGWRVIGSRESSSRDR